MKLTRRKFIIALGGTTLIGAGASAYTLFAEPTWFDVTAKQVPIGRFATPLRILHLSDFHASDAFPLENIATAIDHALTLPADIAFLTGDYITRSLTREPEYQQILRRLTNRIPTYASIGNHDGGRWAARARGYPDFTRVVNLLTGGGVTFLFNQSTRVILGDKRFTIVGLGDYWSDDTHPEGLLFPKRPDDEAVFVLSHNPDTKTLLKPYDWDLICSGHTHGGQLTVPLLGYRPFLPVRDKSFPEGLLTWGNRHIHITRGIGSLHGMRFNCRPEISLLNVT